MDNQVAQMSLTRRPFRRREGQLEDAYNQDHCYHKYHSHHKQHHSFHRNHHLHKRLEIISPSSSETSMLSSAICHYLPAATNSQTTRCDRKHQQQETTSHNHRYSSTRAISIPLLMYLSIIACVSMSLSNLISSNTAQLVHAASASSSSQTISQTASQMSAQQQSNSVIQIPATTTTTATKARYKTIYACEDRQLIMDCETGSRINLIRANFGRFSITQCNEHAQLDLQTDCMSPITFRIMQERCQDRQRCSVNATSTLFGDRCPKTRKYLEVHFQCQTVEPDVVDVRKPASSMMMNPSQMPAQSPIHGVGSSPLKPPNNPTSTPRSVLSSPASPTNNYNYQPSYQEEASNGSSSSDTNMHNSGNQHQQQHQSSTPVVNSPFMIPANALNSFDTMTNKLSDLDNREPIIILMKHMQLENMSRPRCYQWDSILNQWTEKGARILETNQTHTVCAFDQATTYVLVMDYSGPIQTVSVSVCKFI